MGGGGGWVTKERPERLESPMSARGVSAISGIGLGLHWKLRTLNKPSWLPCLLKQFEARFTKV